MIALILYLKRHTVCGMPTYYADNVTPSAFATRRRYEACHACERKHFDIINAASLEYNISRVAPYSILVSAVSRMIAGDDAPSSPVACR